MSTKIQQKIMKCLIVEDELLGQEILTDYIEDTPGLELVGIAINASGALDLIARTQPDLIFLDMHLKGSRGYDVIKSLSDPIPLIVVTTAFDQYSTKGYDYGVTDYLLKPIMPERFAKAIDRARQRHDSQQPNPVETGPPNPPQQPLNYLAVRIERGVEYVSLDTIRYLEAMENYVKIFNDKTFILAKSTLMEIEARLPDSHFLRISRRIIIRQATIQKLNRNNIYLYGGTSFPIGKAYRENVRSRIAAY